MRPSTRHVTGDTTHCCDAVNTGSRYAELVNVNRRGPSITVHSAI